MSNRRSRLYYLEDVIFGGGGGKPDEMSGTSINERPEAEGIRTEGGAAT